MKQKTFLTKLGSIAGAITPVALVANSGDIESSIPAPTLETIIQNLDAIAFKDLIKIAKDGSNDPINLPSSINEANILAKIKLLPGYVSLNAIQKQKLKASDITLGYKDDFGILKITIKNHGSPKVIFVRGFKLNAIDLKIKLLIDNLNDKWDYYTNGISTLLPSELARLDFSDQKWKDFFNGIIDQTIANTTETTSWSKGDKAQTKQKITNNLVYFLPLINDYDNFGILSLKIQYNLLEKTINIRNFKDDPHKLLPSQINNDHVKLWLGLNQSIPDQQKKNLELLKITITSRLDWTGNLYFVIDDWIPNDWALPRSFRIYNLNILQAAKNSKVDSDKFKFIDFKDQDASNSNPFPNGPVDPAKLEKLSLHANFPLKTNYVERSFNITTDPATGIATVVVTFIGGETTKEHRYKIINFKLPIQFDFEKFNSFTNQMLTGKPNQIENGNVDFARLEALSSHIRFPEKTDGVERTFRITTNNEGIATVTIDFTSGEIKRSKNYEISGFKTTTDVDKEKTRGAIQGLGENALAGFSDTSKLPEEMKAKAVLDALKGLVAISNLSPAQQALLSEVDIALAANNGEGTLAVTINNHGKARTFTISGFKTTADVDKEKTRGAVQGLGENALAGFSDTSKLPEEMKAKAVLDALKGLVAISNLSPAQQALLSEVDIALVSDNGKGTLAVTINNHGEARTFTISGFKTNEKVLEDTIQALLENALAGKSDDTKLPSAIKEATVLNWIKALATINSLANDQKALLLEDDISLVHNDNAGTLEVRINNHGDAKVFDEISGFKTTADVDKEKTRGAVQGLGENALAGFSDTSKLPEEMKAKAVLDALKGLAAITTLSVAQQALLSEVDIALAANNGKGTLAVTINNHGEARTFTISGFKTNAKVLEDTIQTLLENALAGNGDDTKLPSAIKEATVLNWIKALATINSLANDQKALLLEDDISLVHNDNAGTLEVRINNHGDAKVFDEISGFKTTADVDKEKTRGAVQGLGENALAGFSDTSKLPDEMKAKAVLDALKGLATISNLSSEQKALLSEADIALVSDNGKGTLEVTINNHGEARTFTISGFKTNEKVLEDTIQTLSENALAGKSDDTKLPSAIKEATVLNWIKALATINSLANDQKALLLEGDISLVHNDNAGTLEVRINNHGDAKVFDEISGFKTTTDVDKEKTRGAVQGLGENALAGFSDTSKLPNEMKAKAVLDALKGLATISNLSSEQKALLSEADIVLVSDNGKGTLEVTINNHGEARTFTISGFKTNEKVLEDTIQTLSENALAGKSDDTKLPSAIKEATVLNWIKALATINSLANDQKALLLEGDISLVHNDNAGTLEVRINNHGDAKVFDEISGFKTTTDVDKEKTRGAVQGLGENALAGFSDTSKLPEEMKAKAVLDALKGLATISNLSSEQQALLSEVDIVLAANNGEGTLAVTINNHGEARTFTISGFKTNEKVLEDTIQALLENALAGKSDDTKLPSAIKEATVLNWIKALATINSLANDQKALLLEGDISLVHNDNAGTLEVRINNHGDAKVFDEISGFKTTTDVDKEKTRGAVQGLGENALAGFSDTSKLPEEMKAKAVLDALKGLAAITTLSVAQQALLSEVDIALAANNGKGTLAVTINNHGEARTFTISGFKTNAKVLEDTIQTLLENALAGNGDDTKLPSAIKEATVLNWIKALATINSLANDQKALLLEDDISLVHNDNAGTLEVRINNHGDAKVFDEISGFKTTADVDKEKTRGAVQGLGENALAGFSDTSKLPDEMKAKAVLDALKGLVAISNLSPEQKALLSEVDIVLAANNGKGTLAVTINNHGEARTFTISGFKTNEKVLEDTIQALLENALAGKSDDTKLPSAIKEATVLDWIKALANINSLANDQKALLLEDDISLVHNDNAGTLEVRINNHGDAKVFDEISGFKTTTDVDKEKTRGAVQGLGENALAGFSDTSKLPDEMKAKAVLDALKGLATISNLSSEQKALLSEADIALVSDNGKGTLEVTINNHGEARTFTISGFKTNEKVLEDTIQTLSENALAGKSDDTKLPSAIKEATVLNWIKALATINSLANDQKALLLEGDISLVHNDNAGTLEVRINNHGDAKVFDEISGFKTTTDVDKEKTRGAVQGLGENALAGFSDTSKLPEEMKAKAVLDALKGLATISNLSSEQQALLSEVDIVLAANNGEGTLAVTINNHGEARTFTISGFKTNEKVLEDTIQALLENALAGKSDDTKLPSAIKEATVLNWIKALATINSLANDQKALLLEDDISLVHNDNAGTLEVRINNHGDAKVFDEISGFKTTADVDKEKTRGAVQGLGENALAGFSDTSKLPEEMKAKAVLDALKGLAAITTLSVAQQALLSEVDIALAANNGKGTLAVTINNHGEARTFTISGFKTNAKVLEDTIQTLLENALAGNGDDTKLPSAIKEATVLNWIKALATINSLANDQKALLLEDDISLVHNDNAGTLEVRINNHGDAKVFDEISGFKTTADVDKEKTRGAVQGLGENALAGFSDTSKLPDEMKAKAVLDALKGLVAISNLSPEQKALLSEVDIVLAANNGKGTLAVTINNHGEARTFTISGFKTNEKVLEDTIQALLENALAGKSDDTKLPSAIKEATVLDWIKALANINSLANDQKALLLEDDISLVHNDNAGTLEVRINNHGDAKVFDEISGFKTTTDVDKEKTRGAVQGLGENALAGFSDTSKLPDEMKAKAVLDALKGLATISNLSSEQKALLSEADIALVSDNGKGTLEVTINNHGEARTFTISGFKTNEKVLEDTIQTLSENALAGKSDDTKLPSAIKEATVLNWIKALATINSLANDQKALLLEGDISLVHNDNAGTLEVRINNHGDAKVFDEISGFKTTTDVDKEKTRGAVQGLGENALAGFSDTSKLPNEMKAKAVLDALKGLATISNLSSEQKALLSEADIVLVSDNGKGTLEVTINNHGEARTFTISGFKTNEKVLEDTIQTLSENALAGKSDDTKLPSAIKEATVLNWIKALATINSLANDQKALLLEGDISLVHNDNAGTLEVRINNHGDAKVFDEISGFKTTTDVDKEKTRGAVQGLGENALAGFSDTSKLPEEMKAKAVLDALKGLATISNLSSEQQALLSEVDIVLAANNGEGTLEVRINNHGEARTFTISGFKTNEKVLEDTIQALLENALAGKSDDTKLPSAIKEATVLNWIKALATINSLANDQKALLLEDDISLVHNDNAGTLEVRINNHGDAKVFDEISGFKTTADVDKEKTRGAVQGLGENALAGFSDTSKLPEEMKAKAVLDALKGLAAITTLSVAQQALLSEVDIALVSDNGKGTLAVTINNHGEARTFTISGFKTNAKVLEDTIQTLLENALAGNGDDTKLPSAIKEATVLNWIKALATINSLDDAQKALLLEGDISLVHNDNAGTLEVRINNHGDAKVFDEISDFKTTTDVDKEKTRGAVQGLGENALAGFSDTSKLPEEMKAKAVLDALKGLVAISNLSPEQQALLSEVDIALVSDNGEGTLAVTINNHGKARTFTISGFKTNAKVLEDTIQTLSENALASKSDDTKLPSAIKEATVLNWIKALATINSLANDQKALLLEGDISLVHNDNAGTLEVRINNHGDAKVFDEISGFKTTADVDKEKTRGAIQGLGENALAGFSDTSKLPEEMKAKAVLDALKGLVAISNLSPEQQALLSEVDIALVSDNGKGTLAVTINNHGEARTFTISGFKTNAKVLEDTIQDLLENALASNGDETKLPSSITRLDVLGWIKALAAIDSLADDQKDLLLEGDINLVHSDNAGTLQVTINGHGEAKTFIVSDFQTNAKKAIEIDKAQFGDFNQAITETIDRISDGDVTKETLEALTEHNSFPAETASVTRTFSIVTNSNGIATVTITFASGEARDTTTYKISGFKTDAQVANEKALTDAISSLENSDLNGLSDNTKLPSAITIDNIIDHLKSLEGVTTLAEDQKTLISDSLLNLVANDEEGLLNVEFNGFGVTKTFEISDFKTTIEANNEIVNKVIQDLTSDALNDLANKDTLPSKINAKNVLDHLKKLETIKSLSNDLQALLFEEDISLKANDSSGILEVTIARHGDDKIFEIAGFKKQVLASDDKPKELSLPTLIAIIASGIVGIGLGGYLVYYLIKRRR